MPTDRRSVWGARVRLAASVALPVALSLLAAWLFKVALSSPLVGAKAVSLLAQLGACAPVLFLLLLAVRPLFLVPGQALAAVAGVLWGGLEGTALCLLGSVLSVLLVASLGRRLLQRPLERWANGRNLELGRLAARRDFVSILVLTLNPLVPTDLAVALTAGAGGRRSRLVAGAVLGSLPGTLATCYFGSALTKDQPALLALSLAAVLVSLVGGGLLARGAWRAVARAAPRPEPVEA